MKYCNLLFIMLLFNQSFGQIQRAFVTKNGSYSNDPKKAISYILISKMADSVYEVNQYSMNDTILVSGFYKDSLLTIPNGKFIYYQKNKLPEYKKGQTLTADIDTFNFSKLRGYFINGKREGVWREYSSDHKVVGEYTFKNDKLDGPFRNFNEGWLQYRAEGTMVNNEMEGRFLVYTKDSLLVEESDYHHDKEVNHVVHYHQASEQGAFIESLENNLRKYYSQLKEKVPVVRFTVDKTGAIKDIQIVTGINEEVDSAVINAIKNGTSYIPANYDGVPIEQTIVTALPVFHQVEISFYKKPKSPPHRPQGLMYQLNPGGVITTQILHK